MNKLREVLGFTVLSLLVGCAITSDLSASAVGCDVSWVGSSSLSPGRACELRVLAKRCAVSDQCQIQCEAQGGSPSVGGGCGHICQDRGGAQTDEDIADNRGLYATAESVACYN